MHSVCLLYILKFAFQRQVILNHLVYFLFSVCLIHLSFKVYEAIINIVTNIHSQSKWTVGNLAEFLVGEMPTFFVWAFIYLHTLCSRAAKLLTMRQVPNSHVQAQTIFFCKSTYT